MQQRLRGQAKTTFKKKNEQNLMKHVTFIDHQKDITEMLYRACPTVW